MSSATSTGAVTCYRNALNPSITFLSVNIVKLVEDVSMITVAATRAAPIEYKD